jgi:hypothetical protein
MNMLASFEIPVTFCLSPAQKQEALAAINTYYLGDAECNYLDPETMEYLAKYPEKETEDFRYASSNVSRTFAGYITVGIDHNGCLSVI